MSVGELRRGEWARVVRIPDESLRIQLLRFGIHDGSRVQCHARLPLGPVVLKSGGQEIALGRQVARGIEVESECACPGRQVGGRGLLY